MNPLVSIVIPVYNVNKYLTECIQSITKQTYENWEIVLVDDGSTDGSSVICDTLASQERRIQTFHKQNGGLSSARNYGTDKSSGEYIIYLDSDDYWYKEDVLSLLIKTALQTDADIVRGEFVYMQDESGVISEPNRTNKKQLEGKVFDSTTMFIDAIAGENFSWLFLFKRHVLEDIRFNEQFLFQEDIEFNVRLFSNQWKCAYTSLPFYVYRQRSNSIMTSPKTWNIKGSFMLSHIYGDYASLIADKVLSRYYYYNAVMMYFWTLCTLAQNPYYQKRNELIKELEIESIRDNVWTLIWKQKIFNRSFVFSMLKTKYGVRVMRFKNNIQEFLIKLH